MFLTSCLTLSQSSHSFVLALNSPVRDGGNEGSYVGGGTFFPELDTTVCADEGCLVSFEGGKTLHGGSPVEAGVRYIIAGKLCYLLY